MPKLSDADISARLGALPRWVRTGDTLTRTITFDGFPQAIAFVVRIAFDAESMNHHPDIDIRWSRVHIALSTHDAGGITEKDFELAGAIDAAAGDVQ
jgi:4a-hydroxytetrahydrobiopterin dehydratase